MARKRIKHTDQEWLDLILDCKKSSVTNQTWCEQHSITIKALAYHTQRLRRLGYDIPNKTPISIPREKQKQEVVCLQVSDGSPAHRWMSSPSPGGSSLAAAHIDFHGILIDLSNHASQEAVTNIFHALLSLC